ncbi:diguanylate cyclase/phosphodiesterase (GGDEF & EAL domains) with PAS/PAC sensor(s) [hydrothermal vent metagenome]|uniref:Diguanylate cyclase/phosphodiesterase (GGDEF & EAL domains) with PAS/PAC sensor(S) n=1 Tax=hydrothermal vent metagenome TaxID=652676 RepID=A0A3B0ZXR8_9ZZZZ
MKYLSAKTSPDLGTTANNSLGSLLFNLLKNNNQTKRSPQIIIWGYIVIVVLFSLILVTSIVQNKRTNDHVSEIVQQYGMKSELITRMYNAARERSISLFTMVSIKDPFVRDENFLTFNSHAAQFANARIKLLKTKLSDSEYVLLKKQGNLTHITAPLQNKIAELVQREEIEEANELLVAKAIPLQEKILDLLKQLQTIQYQAARKIAQQAQQEQQDSWKILLVLSIVVLFSGIVITYIIVFITKSLQSKLYMEKELAEITLHSIGDAIITTDINGKVTQINPVAEELTGYSRRQAIGQDFYSVFNVELVYDAAPSTLTELETVITNLDVVMSAESPKTLVNKNLSEYAIEYTLAPIVTEDRKTSGAVVIFRDVTEIRALSSQLKYYASHDSLTGLINRRQFEYHLGNTLKSTQASSAQQHVVCFMDLDNFKIINDTAGHEAGDEFLKQLSLLLQSLLRRSDILARLGGDEFGILLEDCNIENALSIAEKIRKEIKSFRFIWANNSFEVGASIGLTKIDHTTASLTEIMRNADTACYISKEEGRNRIHLFDPNDEEIQKRQGELQWMQHIKDALKNNDFVLHCQSIMNIADSEKKHCEILLRLRNRDGEIVPPMSFIPAAERYEIMPDIDKWVITNTIKFLSTNQKKIKDHIFTINLSGQSLGKKGFDEFVINTLVNNKIDPKIICFEITETAAISNLSRAVAFMKTLKAIGCRFALDDFGSGLSSFSYLKNMPVDYIKIDGHFIVDICEDKTDLAFVEAINRIGHIMGIETIAEFVENKDTFDALKNIGVNFAQGYYIDKPKSLSLYELGDSDKK